MQQRIVVAVDGPSGSGKSSVSRAVAKRFGLAYLDTGAMYRAFTVWSMSGHHDMSTCPLDMSTDPDSPTVRLDGVDVSEEIRGESVTAAVSSVAARADVRAEAVRRQRELIAAAPRGIVVEGRDITSVVAPDAQVRVFLTADLEARQQRRAAEFADAALAERMRGSVASRDAIDSSREHSPLVEVEGVTRVDATHRTLEEVVELVASLVTTAREGRRS